MRYLLGHERTLIVRGPASLRLLGGHATALGAPLEGLKVVVRQDRQLPIETLYEADLDVVLAESGSMFEVDGTTIPKSWHSAFDSLVEMEQGKVMIIGATDVGKSTMCTFLANRLLEDGIKSRIIDADIGQSDIGPPATLGGASTSGYLSSLLDLSPSALIFIGDTSPSRVQTRLAEGIRHLSTVGQQSLTIINTDGWVSDPEAIIYKIDLIKAIQPDLVLGLASGGELESILSRVTTSSMRIETPTTILTRSRGDRRQIRIAGYRRFLDGGRAVTYSLREVQIKLPNGMRSIGSTRTSDLRNLLIGLLDDDGYLLQIGVLLGFEGNSLKVYSRQVSRFVEIEVGYVKLSTDGVECGYLQL